MKVGIVGLGGLGHMALKFAHSFGAHAVQITTSLRKKEDALRLGADEVILSTDEAQMKAHADSFDFILDAVSAPHALEPYLALLNHDARGPAGEAALRRCLLVDLETRLHRRIHDRRHD